MSTAVRDRDTSRPARPRTSSAVLTCALLAVASLPLPAALGFDPWAWLVWGREITELGLDTTGGPSWKPLPVLLTTLTAPFGAAGSEWVLVVAVRAGSLLGLVAAYRLARRFAGPAAGLVAAALLVLVPDGDPRFLRLIGEAHVAPLSITLSLFALEAHLDHRRRAALVLGWGLAMIRPEAWPLLLAYGVWLWRTDRARRPDVVVALTTVPLLWFGPDWVASGDPLHGADAAQVSADLDPGERLLDALVVVAGMVPAPAWVAATVALVVARRRREHALVVAAWAALAWSVLVVVMATTLGYAALSRFHLPAAGVLCVLAGIGTVRLAERLPDLVPDRRRAVAALLVAASLAAVAPRVLGIPVVLGEVADRSRLEEDLDRLLDAAGGRQRMASCGEVAVAGPGLLRTAVAWKLELPLHRGPSELPDGAGVLILPSRSTRIPRLETLPVVETAARTQQWVALAIRCPSALPDV